MPTSVLLAVLAAAGLLALAPALVRRYDATERLVAERASSTARVLERRRRRRTVPGRRPINPPRIQSVTFGVATPSSEGTAVPSAGSLVPSAGSIVPSAGSGAAAGDPVLGALSGDDPAGDRRSDGQQSGSGGSGRRSSRGRLSAVRATGGRSSGVRVSAGRVSAGRVSGGRLAGVSGGRLAGVSFGRLAGGPGGRAARRPDARRRHPAAVYRRRRVFASLVLLNLVELVGVIAVGPGFWVSFAVTGTLLVVYTAHLRNRALRERRRRRAQAREAAWLAARQAEVRREQARRTAARREAQRRLAAQREALRRAALGVDRGDLPAASNGGSVSYRRAGGLRGRPYQAGPPRSA